MKQVRQSIRFSLVLSFLFSSMLLAQKGPKDPFVFPPLSKVLTPAINEVTLKNGMRLFLVEDHDYPTIDMRALVRTGSLYEPADKCGMASITGTVLRTGGSKKYPGDELDRMLETLGATVETGISQESGYISLSLLKEDIDKGLDILSDLLKNPVFPEDKIDLAKIEYRSAISRRNDDIGSITNREFIKLIYGVKSPYASQAEYATIDAITRADLVAFHKRYFHPDAIIMTVWGDFDSKTMKNKIQKAFAAWPAGKAAVGTPPPVQYTYDFSVHYIEKADVNQSNVMLGHIGGRIDNPDYPALIIMNQILSFERMFKRIRTDEGLAYSVWGDYGAEYSHDGIFSAGCQTKSGSTVKAIRLMLEELQKIRTAEVTEEELAKAKSSYLNGYVFNFDSKAKIVNRLMTYAYFGYPKDFMDRVKMGVEKVTRADVLRVAKKYIKSDVRILVVGNQKDFDEPLAALGPVHSIDITIPVAGEVTAAATTDDLAKGKALLEKARDASGGKEALSKIHNMHASLTLTQETPMGKMDMEAQFLLVYPDKMKADITIPGGTVQMVLAGNDGWIKAPQGTFPMPDAQKKPYQESILRDPLYFMNRIGEVEAQYLGRRDFQGTSVEDILLTQAGYSFHLLLDPETFLPAGNAFMDIGQQGPAQKEEILSEYRNVEGIMLPMRSVVMAGANQESQSAVKEIKLNIEIKPEWFVKE